MLSRVADSIFWINRYIERADNLACVLDVNKQLNLDLPADFPQQWEPLIFITGDQNLFRERYDKPNEENVLHFLMFDTTYPNSIISCLRKARDNALSIRDSLNSEIWEEINSFYHLLNDAARNPFVIQTPHGLFQEIKNASRMFIGTMEAVFTHGEGYHFAHLARMLERADKTSRILDVKYFLLLPSAQHVGSSYDEIQWAALLKSISALQMYRQRHGLLNSGRIVDFLLLDREFPRAVHYCIEKAEQSLHAISGSPQGTYCNPAEQRLGQLHAELAYSAAEDIIASGLHEFLDSLQTKLNRIGDAVFETYFALRPADQLQKQEMGIFQ